MVVDGKKSGLFHYLSGARAAPGVGQLGKDTFSEIWTGFQPKMIMVPYRFLNFYDIFRKYRETSEIGNFD